VSDALVACRDVSVSYGRGEARVDALVDASLEIGPGERVALMGRSGSGKTTLLHVVGGLVEPSAGEVARRSSRLAYVFQGANLLPHFTAFENVAFAVHVARVEAEPELAGGHLLALVGLESKGDHLPAELSGGEQQRVALARALAQQPEVLLCDEPTGHLDSDTSERVLALLDALQERYRFALVIATHDPGVAARLDRVVELHDGRVADEQVLA
jgi:ABC-type lipoprotein export system ATPase subunit